MTEFPRLIYISDVPVEYSSAGGLFMYRLFEGYPPEKLLIVQTRPSARQAMLPGVRYEIIDKTWLHRLLRTRVKKLGLVLEYLIDQRISRRVNKLVQEFKPEAVTTVPHWFYWMVAADVAKTEGLPFHIVLHDDFIGIDFAAFLFKNHLEGRFRKAYQLAASRFCVSPYMEQHHFQRYQVKGSVLFPFSGKNDRRFKVSDLSFEKKPSLNFCYAGSLYVGDYLPMLNRLAEVLKKHGHTLTVLANFDKNTFKSYSLLSESHVSLLPFESREKVNSYLNEKADVNVLLNSFQHLELARLNFPSKLADYCLSPLPVIFWGAPESGLIRWANETQYAATITDQDMTSLENQVERLNNVEYRKVLSERIYQAGIKYFSYQSNFDIFKRGLNQNYSSKS